MNLAIILQYTFLGLSLNILLATLFPSLSSRFMHYGARSQLKENNTNSIKRSESIKEGKNDDEDRVNTAQESPLQKKLQDQKSSYNEQKHASILDNVAAKRLPHHYFTHFYIFSLACLFFWAYQILTGGFVICYLTSYFSSSSASSPEFASSSQSTVTMPPSRILLGWTLLFIQSVRRLGESLVLASKPSSSSMWIGHYVVGLTFYLLVNPAVYLAEALPTLQALQEQQLQLLPQAQEGGEILSGEESSRAQQYQSALTKMAAMPDTKILATTILSQPIASAAHALATMRLRTAILLPLFLLASALQHDAHMHLASLKDKSVKDKIGNEDDNNNKNEKISSTNTNNSIKSKNTYSLPTHPLFSHLIAPHYTLEVAIYIIIALLVAPNRLEGTIATEYSNISNSSSNITTTTTLPINHTVAAAAIFAAVNLGVTAAGTRQWYAARFGHEAAVQGKWTLVPFVW